MTDKLIDRREPGFYIVDNEIIEVYGARLGVYGIAVYNVLLKFSNASGENAFPSYQTIADLLGMSRPKAVEGVKLLLECGLIEKTPRMSSSGDPTTNIYTLLDVKKVVGGGKQHLPPSKQHLPGGGKQDLLGGKPRLPDQDPVNNTPLDQDPINNTSPSDTSLRSVSPPPNPTQAILRVYEEALNYKPTNYGKEGKAAKELAKRGYTPEDVVVAYHALKKRPFWASQHLSLTVVLENIAALGNYANSGGDINSIGRPKNKADQNRAAFDEFEAMLKEKGLWSS